MHCGIAGFFILFKFCPRNNQLKTPLSQLEGRKSACEHFLHILFEGSGTHRPSVPVHIQTHTQPSGTSKYRWCVKNHTVISLEVLVSFHCQGSKKKGKLSFCCFHFTFYAHQRRNFFPRTLCQMTEIIICHTAILI